MQPHLAARNFRDDGREIPSFLCYRGSTAVARMTNASPQWDAQRE
jgi:hypothetical protein